MIEWFSLLGNRMRRCSLDAAWAEVEAALPEESDIENTGPWEIGHLIRTNDEMWTARAQSVLAGGTVEEIDADGLTPTSALRTLATKLRAHAAASRT